MRPITSRSAFPVQMSTRHPCPMAAWTASATTSATRSIGRPSTGERGPTSASTPDDVETDLQTAIDAAAAFGANQMRIDAQNDFLKKQVDALKEGVGALVDADMEEASARLQALQVQQQLGIQALSIANQNPQNILALFR